MPEHEGANPDEDELFQPTAEQLAEEQVQKSQGFIPERWLKIEGSERGRMRTGLEATLAENTKEVSEQEISERQETVRRYFKDLLLAPSFENGPYAAAQWLNLPEMVRKIVDIKLVEASVPDQDSRVGFYSNHLRKDSIIQGVLADRIQIALGESGLTANQLSDCLTNLRPEQLDTIVDQIAKSGMPLHLESPKERWTRIVGESSKQ